MSEPSPDTKSIIAVIAGRPYPLRVAPIDEDDMRSLVKEINERFNDFQIKYSDRDKQDCLVMTLLTYADELRSARQAVDMSEGGVLSRRISSLNDLVDSLL